MQSAPDVVMAPSGKDGRALIHVGTSFTTKIRKTQMLERDEEVRLARLWREEQDISARNALVAAHLPLALKQAFKLRRGEAQTDDLLQEATMGLMTAAEKFDPDLGWRFATYAQWWVKAALQDYAIRNKSIVRVTGSGAQRRLFFSLRKTMTQIEQQMLARGETPEPGKVRIAAAEYLGITRAEFESIEGRVMASDASLNARKTTDGEEGTELQDRLADDAPGPEALLLRKSEEARHLDVLSDAMKSLNDRERLVIEARRLRDDDGETLHILSDRLGVSRERVRQIEVEALRKLRRAIEKAGNVPDFSPDPLE